MAEALLPGGLQCHVIDFNTSAARVEVADDNLILTSNDHARDGQDVMDMNDILIGPEGFITVLSGGTLMLDTSDDVGGEPGTDGTVVGAGIDNSAGGGFLPDTLVTVPDITLDYPARHRSWSNRPLADFMIKSDPHP